jgi:ABC-type nickel/cobalt efflux system permease component RcnA
MENQGMIFFIAFIILAVAGFGVWWAFFRDSDDDRDPTTPPAPQHSEDQHSEDQHSEDQHSEDQHSEDQHSEDQHSEDQHSEDQEQS